MADSLDSAQNVGGGSIIQPIEEESVRRIVAGQAVSDLASAVKELVDNSLDAGSKSINSMFFCIGLLYFVLLIRIVFLSMVLLLVSVRLFNQGLDIVEVSDDGFGVPPESRPFLAQAHATSKIRSFDDIYNSSTSSLGFRGEALFCLSNLSDKLIVATRTAEEALGQKMEFNHDGSLDSKSIVSLPRKVGTTVAVLKLLNSLPVRRADMQRRIVQHRSKLMNLMEGCKCITTIASICSAHLGLLDDTHFVHCRCNIQSRGSYQSHGCGGSKRNNPLGDNRQQP